jgi:uncharacterized repeat protein (TIGR03847 family)
MSVDLGRADILGADAVGQPGQRRFRLFVSSPRGSAVMWMEKTELNTLSLTLDRAIAMVTQGQVLRVEAHAGSNQPRQTGMPADFPVNPAHEFQVGHMQLSYNEQSNIFLLRVSPLELSIEDRQEPHVVINEEHAVSFAFSLQEAQHLSEAITTTVAGGRPVCPLCHELLGDGPHACVRQNGHKKIITIEEDDDEE